MQRSSVSAKIMLGPTASDVIVTDPKNTGEECTFTTTNRQLPLALRYSRPIVEKTPMTVQKEMPEVIAVPKHLLKALAEFLTSHGSASISAGLNYQAFRLEGGETCFLTAESGSPHWFFRPFRSSQRSSVRAVRDSKIASNDWIIDGPLTTEARKACKGISADSSISSELDGLVVMENPAIGTVLCFQFSHLQHVATILQKWGNPPDGVIRDWKSQMKSIENALSSTAETFVSEDGRLVPLSKIVHQIVHQLSDDASSELKRETIFAKGSPFLATPPDWPWLASQTVSKLVCNEIPSLTWLNDLGSRKTAPFKVSGKALAAGGFSIGSEPAASALPLSKSGKASKKTRLIGAAILFGIISISALAFYFASPNRGHPPGPIAKANDTKAVAANTEAVATNKNSANKSMLTPDPEPTAELLELVTTPNPSDTMEETESAQNEKMVQSLLSELSPIGSNSIRLDQSSPATAPSPASIISDLLKPNAAEAGLTNLSLDEATEMPNNTDVDSNSNTSEAPELDVVTTEQGVITLKKPLTLRSAYAKEIVSIGKPVLAKASRCEIELKLTDKVVMEPMEVTTIEGTGTATWKIAIEDESPELFVKIESKPGARWEVKARVGLREERDAMLFSIGPRDAQNVGNRLIDYNQRVSFTIESLRTQRSNSRGKFSSVIAAHIKQLEIQEKEVEKAIERWKVIARLSHFFFDTNEVRIQFTAIEKEYAK